MKNSIFRVYPDLILLICLTRAVAKQQSSFACRFRGPKELVRLYGVRITGR